LNINTNDVSSTTFLGGLDDGKTDGTETKDNNSGVGFNLAVVDDSTPTSGDTAAQKAHFIDISSGVDLGAGDFSNNGVFTER
jgi:hypothetical protein